MIIPVKTSTGGYDIILERGALKKAKDYLNLDRKVFIVTDSGVPRDYAETLNKQCKEGIVYTIPMGETSKNFDVFKGILEKLVENDFTRTDCLVAVGGGVVGDMAGFAASVYMRGIDFYNIPTTLLSQVDSSIGGKTAIDFKGLKNIIGAFYPPKCVIIDANTLSTLPKRQISNGLAESVKMAMTCDKELFELFEKGDIEENLDRIIEASLRIKKFVVEEDEKEAELRKVLNFGHTLAHAAESVLGLDVYFHGECVAAGMVPMCSNDAKKRLIPVLKKLNLPTYIDAKAEKLYEAMKHDKKTQGEKITLVCVEKIGEFKFLEIPIKNLKEIIKEAVK